jgi:hypothetical protein
LRGCSAGCNLDFSNENQINPSCNCTIILLRRIVVYAFFFPYGLIKTPRQLSKKLSYNSNSATSQIDSARKHSRFKNLYVELKFQVLLSADTLQNAIYSQNLFAGHLPSDETIYRLNDKEISFDKGKVIALSDMMHARW